MPFEDAPRDAFRKHELVLIKGTAYVPIFHLAALINKEFKKFFRKLPQPVMSGKHRDRRVRSLVALWDTLAFTAPAQAMQLGGITDIAQLVKPACITAALTQYPDLGNRKLLSGYMARLGQPVQLLFRGWRPSIDRKYNDAAQAAKKREEIGREVKQWHAKSKDVDFHTCETLLMSGKCPYFKPGDGSPAAAINRCWNNIDFNGKRTPAAFTRART